MEFGTVPEKEHEAKNWKSRPRMVDLPGCFQKVWHLNAIDLQMFWENSNTPPEHTPNPQPLGLWRKSFHICSLGYLGTYPRGLLEFPSRCCIHSQRCVSRSSYWTNRSRGRLWLASLGYCHIVIVSVVDRIRDGLGVWVSYLFIEKSY